MKKWLIIGLGLVAVIAAGIWYYTTFDEAESQDSPYRSMPAQVGICAEFENLAMLSASLDESAYGFLIKSTDVWFELERDVLEVALAGVRLAAFVLSARGHWLGTRVRGGEHVAKQLGFRRLPPGRTLSQELLNAAPGLVPVEQRFASKGFVYRLDVVEEVRAGVEESRLVFGGHLVP